MAKKDVLLRKARNNPKGWRFRELESMLKQWGFVIIPKKGSHFMAIHEETGVRTGLVNHPKELSPAYVRNAVSAVDEVIAKIGETHG